MRKATVTSLHLSHFHASSNHKNWVVFSEINWWITIMQINTVFWIASCCSHKILDLFQLPALSNFHKHKFHLLCFYRFFHAHYLVTQPHTPRICFLAPWHFSQFLLLSTIIKASASCLVRIIAFCGFIEFHIFS